MNKRRSLLVGKLLYTGVIVLIYILGKSLPLYMVDYAAYVNKEIDAEGLLIQAISGDIHQCSVFALGISPYMMASIAVQVFYIFKSAEARKRTSPIKKNRIVLKATLVVSIIMAILQVRELHFLPLGTLLPLIQAVAAIEMIAGALLVLHLASQLKKYGVGGQSTLIFINILDGIIVTMRGHEAKQLLLPLVISLGVIIIMYVMENMEKRIPVQRISIHNVYADKNYFAIKWNPIGVMPAMFSTAFFMLPQLAVSLLSWILPHNTNVLWLRDNMSLSKPVGIVTYAVILFGLTVGFSRVLINPKEITENFLKSGDSIQDLHAGKETRRYLSKIVTGFSMLSATVMCICLCLPLLLQMNGELKEWVTTLPCSFMMLTGVWCNLSREISAIRDLEAYKPFI